MSITVRLSRTGRKNLPSYRIVVCNTRDKRNGRYIDILGFFNPSMKPAQFKLDEKKLKEWRSKGALISDAVEKLAAGKYDYKKYTGSKTGAPAEEKKETE